MSPFQRITPARSPRQTWQARYGTGLLMVLVSLLLPVAPASASETVSPLVRLFDEEVLAENVFAVRQRARSLAPEARYDYLRAWVLPSHSSIRLFAKLTPAEPVPPIQDEHPFDQSRLRVAVEQGQRRVPTGGNLVSPVYDLMDIAQQLNRLDELRAEVQALQLAGEIPERGQLCLLALIEMARGDEKAAAIAADQLFARLATGAAPKLIDRMPETLFVWAAAERGVLLMEAERFLVPIWDNQIRVAKNSGPGEWDRMMPVLLGRVRHARQYGLPASQLYNSPMPLSTWHGATRKHSWSIGSGVPAAHWQLVDRTAVCLSRHDEEYLCFGTPLRGDFTVECLCTGFGYRDSHPSVAGTWIAPVYMQQTVAIGDVSTVRPQIPLSSNLSHLDDFVRYRIEVRGRVCSRFINGRLIHTETLPEEHDPWVAIRVPNFGHGHVRDVRITGSPTIPKRITLSKLRTAAYYEPLPTGLPFRPISQLHGWIPWHDDLWKAELQMWQLEEDEAGQTVIVGRRQPEHAGVGDERLLRYHWPLVWDSEVSYEFFYREGASLVHPAIGRKAFLLDRVGVQTHWISNGVWDQSDLDPLNATPAPDSPATLPLKPDAWNTMSLRITGDTLQLQLNGVPIYRGELEPTNDRTFGLFYDCGQTEARVRNIVLQGNWPQTLPPVAEQELRGTQTDAFDLARDALPATFDFDFTKATLPELESQFFVSRNKASTPGDLQMQPDGLHVTASAPVGQYAALLLGANLQVEGDFDITSRFEHLQLKLPEQGSSGVYQCTLFSKPMPRHYNLLRTAGQFKDMPLRQVIQLEIFNLDPARRGPTYPAIFTDESPAGRLRTVRRGQTLSFLAASYDSDSFQVLHSEEVTDESLHFNDIHLRASCHSHGGTEARVSVVWKEIRVRAEKIINRKSIVPSIEPKSK